MSTKTQYFGLNGGLDQISSVYEVKNGAAIDAENFEIAPGGGYSRIAGFERFDGRPDPHKAPPVAGMNAEELAQSKHAEANARRAVIEAVPGSGPVRGVIDFEGTVLAFRDAVDGLSCKMYRASVTGWQLVSTPSLLPAGRYKFAIWNFGGSAALRKLYGVDGKNPAFEFDGSTFTQLSTGMDDDRPTLVAAHKNHLFLAFGHSLQHSAIADPSTWSPVMGAAEIAMGDEITNLLVSPGGSTSAALMVTTKESIRMLYGNSSADWNLVTLSQDTGAYPGSLVAVGSAFSLSRRGIAAVLPDNTFANFNVSTISDKVVAYLNRFAPALRGVTVSYLRNQFIYHFASGQALVATVSSQGVLGFMPLDYKRGFTCFSSSSLIGGEDLILAGGEDGFVYRLNVGTSFDGQDIPARLWLSYIHFGTPRQRKRWRKAVPEVTSEGYGTFAASAMYDFADPAVQPFNAPDDVHLSPGFQLWDTVNWDQFFFDGRPLAPLEIKMEGSGETASLMFESRSQIAERFTLHGAIIHYDVRRLSR
ncbi:MAG: hypothetical protein RBR77_14030 [Thauera sp.]|nr:hypothetical protein [Thauera sp.]